MGATIRVALRRLAAAVVTTRDGQRNEGPVAVSRAALDAPPFRPMLWHMPDNQHPTEARRASLFRNGRNQALRIPKVFELPGDEVMVHREGNRLIIEPITKKRGLLETLAELQPLDEELPNVDEELLPLDDIDLDRG
jgi:antitoxin VapB